MHPRQIPSSSSSSSTERENNSMMLDNEMASPPTSISISPFIGTNLSFSKINENNRPLTPPIKFATTTNAFGLTSSSSNSISNLSSTSPSASSSSSNTFRDIGSSSSNSMPTQGPVFGISGMRVDISPPSAGSITTRKLRRPSMLSLQQNISFGSDNSGGKADDESTPMGEVFTSDNQDLNISNERMNVIQDPSSSRSVNRIINPPMNANPFNANTLQPTPRWAGHGGSFANAMIRRTSSAPSIPFEDLKTSTPPISATPRLPETDENNMDMEEPEEDLSMNQNKSPLKWAPSHLQSSYSRLRKGKGKMDPFEQNEADGISSLPTSPTKPTSTIHAPAFGGKPLPNALLQTLASEERPLDHEMQSEARLQRFLLSHPQKLPLTPRAPKGSRGRFPDQVGGDDDDEDELLFPGGSGRRSISWTTTRRSRNWMDRARFDDDSDTESEEDDEEVLMNSNNNNNHNSNHTHRESNGGKEEPVINAFAAGMDMDRPRSSSSSSVNMWSSGVGGGNVSSNNNSNSVSEGSGKSTPPHLSSIKNDSAHQPGSGSGIGNPFPTPPSSSNNYPFPPNFSNSHSARLSFSSSGQGMAPSPGYGLPSAFGGLGMGGNGIGTPLGSPTVERSELGASPSAGMGVGSPNLMLYRESQGGQATVRPGKRKAQAEDRFDPYKRPRGTSPSLLGSSPFPSSPSRTNAIPIPQSPSHAPLYPSALSSLSNNSLTSTRHTRPAHPYTRPMSSRSRAASPALSIGSTSGLSSSLGNNNSNNGNRPFNLGEKAGGPQLGGLGLLSLQHVTVNEEDEKESGGDTSGNGSQEMLREDYGDRMEED